MGEQRVDSAKTLEKIKSRGYWKVVIRPNQFRKELIGDISQCLKIVEECRVKLRGWDYPHIGNKSPPYSGEDYVESVTDWDLHKEFWRMYQSGQFLHLFGVHEDWFDEEESLFGHSKYYKQVKPWSLLEVIMALYSFTEIYEFASRLSQKASFGFLSISITLHGMNGRQLGFFEVGRTLHAEYVCHVNEISREREMHVETLLGKGKEISLDETLEILKRFNWISPPREILKEDQRKLLEGLP